MEYLTSEEVYQKNFEEDLRYIKNELIAHQANGNYCKISKILNCITVENLTKEKYMDYWLRQYKNKHEENERKLIIETINDKFENGILPLEEAIKVTKESKDIAKEKERLLKVITVTKKPTTNNDEGEDEEDE